MERRINLVHDVLDNRLVDLDGEPLGRVDGLVAEVNPHQPPRLLAIETGLPVLRRRLTGRSSLPGVRIAWNKVREVGLDVQVDEPAAQFMGLNAERWLSTHVIRWLPWGRE